MAPEEQFAGEVLGRRPGRLGAASHQFEAVLPLPLQFRGAEGGFAQHLPHQTQRGRELPPRRVQFENEGVQSGIDVERRAAFVQFVEQIVFAPAAGAGGQQIGGEGGNSPRFLRFENGAARQGEGEIGQRQFPVGNCHQPHAVLPFSGDRREASSVGRGCPARPGIHRTLSDE